MEGQPIHVDSIKNPWVLNSIYTKIGSMSLLEDRTEVIRKSFPIR